MIKGRIIILSLNINGETKRVMAGKSCSYSVTRDKMEVASPTSGKMLNYVQTTMVASVSCNGLVADPSYLHDIEYAMANGTPIYVLYNVGGRCTNVFQATIDSMENSGDASSIATYNMKLTSNGPINHGHAVYSDEGTEVSGHRINPDSISTNYGGGIMIVKVKIPCTSRITVTLIGSEYFMYASGDIDNDSIRMYINDNNISGLASLRFCSPIKQDGLTSLNEGTYTFLMNKSLPASIVLFEYTL